MGNEHIRKVNIRKVHVSKVHIRKVHIEQKNSLQKNIHVNSKDKPGGFGEITF